MARQEGFLAFFVVSLFAFVAVRANLLHFLKFPEHDGYSRICHLTQDNFTELVTLSNATVVIFRDHPDVKGHGKYISELERVAEETAQVLQLKQIRVCVVELQKLHLPPEVRPKDGDIYIYRNGRRNIYHGRKTSSALLSYLFKLNASQVKIITGKLDKVAFDAVQTTRLVGFFIPGTADYKIYEEAAAMFSPSVAFYAVTDRMVAKHLKLDIVGQINMFRPLQKVAIPCPTNPATLLDIENLIKTNKGAAITIVNEQNIDDPQLLDPNRILVLAIGERTSALGGYFYQLLTKLVRNNTNCTEFQNLNILWVDAESFPAVYVMLEQISTTFGIPNSLPALGTVNVTDSLSAWFNMALLNTTSDKLSDVENMRHLQDWFVAVISQTLQTIRTGSQRFSRMPQSQVVSEGSPIVLDCRVDGIVGDCLWLKDGHNIGFNLARYQHYNWAGDALKGDCSLIVTGAQKGRDDGQWVCEVTGDETNPTITSFPAQVTITPTSTAKTEF